MIFTQNDYIKIENWLKARAIKDSQLDLFSGQLSDDDYITVVQDGINKTISIKDLVLNFDTKSAGILEIENLKNLIKQLQDIIGQDPPFDNDDPNAPGNGIKGDINNIFDKIKDIASELQYLRNTTEFITEDAKNQVDNAYNAIDKLESLINQYGRDWSNIGVDIDEIKGKLEILGDSIQDGNIFIELVSRLDVSEGLIEQIGQKLNTQEQTFVNLERRLNTSEGVIEDVASKVDIQTGEVTKLSSKLDAATGSIETFVYKSNDLENKYSKIEQKADEIKQEVSDYKTDSNSRMSRIEQDAESITQKVLKVENNAVTQTELQQTAEGLNASIIKVEQAVNDMVVSGEVNASLFVTQTQLSAQYDKISAEVEESLYTLGEDIEKVYGKKSLLEQTAEKIGLLVEGEQGNYRVKGSAVLSLVFDENNVLKSKYTVNADSIYMGTGEYSETLKQNLEKYLTQSSLDGYTKDDDIKAWIEAKGYALNSALLAEHDRIGLIISEDNQINGSAILRFIVDSKGNLKSDFTINADQIKLTTLKNSPIEDLIKQTDIENRTVEGQWATSLNDLDGRINGLDSALMIEKGRISQIITQDGKIKGSVILGFIADSNGVLKSTFQMKADNIIGLANKIRYEASQMYFLADHILIGTNRLDEQLDIYATNEDLLDKYDNLNAAIDLTKNKIGLLISDDDEIKGEAILQFIVDEDGKLLSDFTVDADRINLLADTIETKVGSLNINGDNINVTSKLISAIAEDINIKAEKITYTAGDYNLIANNLDLSSNDTAKITASKINAIASEIYLTTSNITDFGTATSGFVTNGTGTGSFSSMFASAVIDAGLAKTAEITAYVNGQISGIELTADKIKFDGYDIDMSGANSINLNAPTITLNADQINYNGQTVFNNVVAGLFDSYEIKADRIKFDITESFTIDAKHINFTGYKFNLTAEQLGINVDSVKINVKDIRITASQVTDFDTKVEEKVTALTSGFMATNDFASMFSQAVDSDGNIVKQAEISAFITKKETGELISNAIIKADNIDFTGSTIKISAKDNIDFTGYKFNITADDLGITADSLGITAASLNIKATDVNFDVPNWSLSANKINFSTTPSNFSTAVKSVSGLVLENNFASLYSNAVANDGSIVKTATFNLIAEQDVNGVWYSKALLKADQIQQIADSIEISASDIKAGALGANVEINGSSIKLGEIGSNVTFKGTLSGPTGNIGGWTINSNGLSCINSLDSYATGSVINRGNGSIVLSGSKIEAWKKLDSSTNTYGISLSPIHFAFYTTDSLKNNTITNIIRTDGTGYLSNGAISWDDNDVSLSYYQNGSFYGSTIKTLMQTIDQLLSRVSVLENKLSINNTDTVASGISNKVIVKKEDQVVGPTTGV